MTTTLTKNFTLEELTATSYKIKNVPGTQAVAYLTALCCMVLQPLRDVMCEPVRISSGYRCSMLNKLVGGKVHSQHLTGMAADLCIDGDIMKGRQWFCYIRDHLTFDQLIWEHDATGVYWVHVSYNPKCNRGDVINDLLK